MAEKTEGGGLKMDRSEKIRQGLKIAALALVLLAIVLVAGAIDAEAAEVMHISY